MHIIDTTHTPSRTGDRTNTHRVRGEDHPNTLSQASWECFWLHRAALDHAMQQETYPTQLGGIKAGVCESAKHHVSLWFTLNSALLLPERHTQPTWQLPKTRSTHRTVNPSPHPLCCRAVVLRAPKRLTRLPIQTQQGGGTQCETDRDGPAGNEHTHNNNALPSYGQYVRCCFISSDDHQSCLAKSAAEWSGAKRLRIDAAHPLLCTVGQLTVDK